MLGGSTSGALGSVDDVVGSPVEGVMGIENVVGLLFKRAGGGYLAKKRISRGGSDLASSMW